MKEKTGGGPIVGKFNFLKNILAFIKNTGGGQAPQLPMGATPMAPIHQSLDYTPNF